MCDIVGLVERRRFSRQQVFAGAAAAGAAAFAPRPSAAQVLQTQQRIATMKARASGFRTKLVLLGTAGGPTWWPGTDRHGTASLLIVGDAMYLIDCGDGVGRRLIEALEPIKNTRMFANLRALFLTHLHSDHTVDYPNLLLYGLYSGLDLHAGSPLHVIGPGRRGEMEPVFVTPGKTRPAPPTMNAANPTPGTVDLTNALYAAYATDINDRIRDNGKPDLRTLVRPQDIALPSIPSFSSPNATPTPDMAPFKIYEDDRVRVWATLVHHAPIFPAFAFRFDTDDGSVVFSGDTSPTPNLVRLAAGAQILVHEVIVTKWIDLRVPAPRSAADEGLRTHLLNAHTPVEEVGKVAEAAGVRQLVLSHIVPGNASDADLAPARQGFSGNLIVGHDLMQIPVGRTAI